MNNNIENYKKAMEKIHPSEELVISHLERDMDTIDSVYEIGYQDGLKIVNQVKRYIGGRVNEQKRK